MKLHIDLLIINGDDKWYRVNDLGIRFWPQIHIAALLSTSIIKTIDRGFCEFFEFTTEKEGV